MSVKKYVFFVVLLTGIITLVGYYYLGGFKGRTLDVVEVDDYQLTGKRYYGRLDSPALEDIFYEVRSQAQSGRLEGTLVIVVFKEPENEKDSVDQFIGILLDQPAESGLPEGWESFTIEANRAVRNTIRSHNLVMPKPNVIRDEIEEYAQEQQLPLRKDVTIEKYLGERHLEIEVPVEQ